MNLLGISALYHDSAACLVIDGKIAAAAQEERFTRKRHDSGFPAEAIKYCLASQNLRIGDVDYLIFYDKPLLTFDRLLETYLAFPGSGIQSFWKSMPVWLKEKLFLKSLLKKYTEEQLGPTRAQILFTEHHQSHAASAFYPSPFDEAAVLCLDGVGEWATTSAWVGEGAKLRALWEIQFPHSLGLLYSAITYFTGFKVNSGEYKVMGLAPYGNPTYADKIREHLIDIKSDGTFRLNLDYFDYCTGLKMTSPRLNQIFDGPPRAAESQLTQREMDLARSVQVVTEEVVLKIANTLYKETGKQNLCLAGGVALNCVANGRLLREGPFKGLWIQPAAGDSGGALGAALLGWHEYLEKPRKTQKLDSMQGSYLGPQYSNSQVEADLHRLKVPFKKLPDDELFDYVARRLSEEAVAGWFQGRMEFGPRALGARSILGDARSIKMQSTMNLKIKYRESFRPFAPSVLREHVSEYFEMDSDSPYMLLVAPVHKSRQKPLPAGSEKLWGIDLLNVPKSEIPAATHVDFSARVQTVHKETNPRYSSLLEAFYRKTGCPVIVNTSFNVRGEPIVCTPEDAIRCFMRTEMDLLVLENCVIEKTEVGPIAKDDSWMKQFELD